MLDTNVVFDLFTPFGDSSARSRASSRFFKRALLASSSVFVSVLTYYELYGIIENRYFHSVTGRSVTSEERKRLRREHRSAVTRRLAAVWSETRENVTVLPADVKADRPEKVDENRLERTFLDGYDPLILASALDATPRIGNIVTHDRDFESVSGIIVWTVPPGVA